MRPFRWALGIALVFTLHRWAVAYREEIASFVQWTAARDWLPMFDPAVMVPFSGALFLFVRNAREDPLQHPTRRRIRSFVESHPGSSLSEIAQAVGIGWGTAVHHVERLQAAGALASQKDGRRRAFLALGQIAIQPRAYLARASAVRGRLYEAIARRPGLSQHELARIANVSPSSASKHLRQLERGGFVAARRAWRSRLYHPTLPQASQSSHAPLRSGAASASSSPRGTSAP
jgi:predicted transcriptional regulator